MACTAQFDLCTARDGATGAAVAAVVIWVVAGLSNCRGGGAKATATLAAIKGMNVRIAIDHSSHVLCGCNGLCTVVTDAPRQFLKVPLRALCEGGCTGQLPGAVDTGVAALASHKTGEQAELAYINLLGMPSQILQVSYTVH